MKVVTAIFGFLLVALSASAQSFQMRAGTSTLMDSSGASVKIYAPHSVMDFGVGVAQGQFVFGVSDSFHWRDYDVTAGDSQLGFSLDNAGLGVAIRGLSVKRTGEHQSFGLFAGSTNLTYGTPYFSGVRKMQHLGIGTFFKHRFSNGLTSSSLLAVEGGKHSAIESLKFERLRFSLSGAGGLLAGKTFTNLQISAHPLKPLRFSGVHQDLWEAAHVSANSASAFLNFRRLDFNAAIFSGRTVGETVGIEFHAEWIDARFNYYKTTTNSVNMIFGERIGRRTRVTETFSLSNGGNDLSIGGSYEGRHFSVSVGHQTVFLPFAVSGQSAFHQVLTVSLRLQLPHNSSLNIESLMLPDGKVRHTVYGDTWAYRNVDNSSSPSHKALQRYSIEGNVVEPDGQIVVGAAIRIGKETVFSDSHGHFSLRFSKPIAVIAKAIPEEFLVGTWAVISTPVTVTAALEESVKKIQIVVRKAQ